MKKIFFYALGLLGLFSCGDNVGSEEVKMLPGNNVELAGLHKNLIGVKDSAKLILSCVDKENDKWVVKVLLPLENKQGKVFSEEEYGDNYKLEFGNVKLVALDSYGAEIEDSYLDKTDYDCFRNLLNAPYGNEKMTGQFELYASQPGYKATKEYFDKISNLKLNEMDLTRVYSVSSSSSDSDESEVEEEEATDESNNDINDSDDETVESTSSNTEDWDELLDAYEDYVDEYAALFKKAANGDMSAVVEYANMLEKAEKISKKLGNGEGKMSPRQVKRYMEITNKMAQSLTEE